jgi:hypothetical protein
MDFLRPEGLLRGSSRESPGEVWLCQPESGVRFIRRTAEVHVLGVGASLYCSYAAFMGHNRAAAAHPYEAQIILA